ncbi:MAG: beta-ketoacyl synthase N-terminal-like domain-containing protein, partial [Chloroflexota bacterium]
MSGQSSQRATLLQAYQTIKKLEAKLKSTEQQSDPIAIVGLSGRYPGGANLDDFWQTLYHGVDATGEHPTDRWDIAPYYDPTPGTPGKIYIERGAYVANIDQFDARFFGISPREADNMDPQQRLVLEVSWETLEHANLPPDRLKNSRTGVYVGVSNGDYMLLARERIGVDQYAGFGGDPAPLAGRLSYILGLQGPSMTVMTMCSSSSVAIHLASQALRAGECELALAGGVHLNVSHHSAGDTCLMQAVSADGRCRSFAATANGYGRGEGCGMVALKRLSDAVAAGDIIHAVIRGSAVNHDGPSGALTVPNGPAQEAMIQQALAAANLESHAVSYVEAHGTGTPLGDPIEARALGRVYGQGRTAENPLLIGSVKSNISHTEAASGVAGLTKVVLAMQHGELPASLHFDKPNPHIDWANIPIQVLNKRTPWERPAESGERMAGVSSFGMTGTNAHIIVAEPPINETDGTHPDESVIGGASRDIERPYQLLTLSAKTPSALQELADRYIQYLNNQPADNLLDIAFTMHVGRSHHPYRLSWVVQSLSVAQERLNAWRLSETSGAVEGHVSPRASSTRVQ